MLTLRRKASHPDQGASRRRFLSTGGITVAGALASSMPLTMPWSGTAIGVIDAEVDLSQLTV